MKQITNGPITKFKFKVLLIPNKCTNFKSLIFTSTIDP